MGRAARRAFMRRTTPTERFDLGLQMTEEHQDDLISQVEVPEHLEGEDRQRFIFRALRKTEG